MGVLGLWQILEPVGHPIKIEGLEGKRLGVDANVWLYKFIRGFREKDNTANLDAHKLGLFNRISKLLFYKIKPVFVFDGPAPVLKRRTLERRQNVRNKNLIKVQDTAMKLLAEQLIKQYPGANLDQVRISLPELRSNNLVAAEKFTDEDRELFYLPPEKADETIVIDDESDDEKPSQTSTIKVENTLYHVDTDEEYEIPAAGEDVDIESEDFSKLPAEVRYEILTDIKEARRKLRRAHALPEDANTFSNLQMERLLSRRLVQEKIEQCEKDICSMYTGEFDGQSVRSYRMQSDSTATMIYLSNTQSKDSESLMDKKPSTVLTDSKPAPSSPASASQPNMASGVTVLPPASTALTTNRVLERVTFERRQNVRNKNLIKVQDTAMKLLAEQPIEQYPGTNLDQVRISSPELRSNNLVAAEKFTDEDRELFCLPPEKADETIVVDDESDGEKPSQTSTNQVENTIYHVDTDEEYDALAPVEDVDIESEDFSNSSAEVRYEILTDALPEDANTFSNPQMKRLPSPMIVQEEIEQCEEDICSTYTGEFDGQSVRSYRMQSDTTATMIYLSNSPSKDSESLMDKKPSIVSIDSEPAPSSPASASQPNIASGVTVPPPATTALATNRVTHKIVEEAKELLRLFGIPYIDAAGEAEAQCALLEELKLTEGTITDDSDVWLFGAQNVYRYFFSDDKYVMQYKMTDIEFHVRMNRETLVCFAMLVGSDYTDGLMNVGPVNALEILSEFPGKNMEPLIKFKEWRDKYERSKDRVPGSRKREKMLKFRLPEGFPSRTVFEGYTKPTVDCSTETFTWGTPELDELREYARRQFGWDLKKADDKLLPVMKKLSERSTQPTIDKFFFKTAANENPELFRSKRVNEALNKIAKVSSQSVEVVNLSETDSDSPEHGAAPVAKKLAAVTGRNKRPAKGVQRGRKAAKKSEDEKKCNLKKLSI